MLSVRLYGMLELNISTDTAGMIKQELRKQVYVHEEMDRSSLSKLRSKFSLGHLIAKSR